MGKFNTVKKEQTVVTHQGGTGYAYTPELALVMLMSAGLTSKFYQTEKQVIAELDGLIEKVAKKDKLLLAKMIIYTRSTLGQRSITHYAAAKMASLLEGEEWGKKFFSKRSRKENRGGVVFRLDDMMEIVGAYKMLNKQEKIKLSNAMKKGFALVLENSDPYELAKYKAEGSEIKLVDIVNLVHPKAKGETAEALKALVEGTLKEDNTRQSKNTESGKQVAELVKKGEVTKEKAVEVLNEKKSANYRELLENKRMGYMDLIRNIRNILNTDASLIEVARPLLLDKKLIEQSRIFPHQIDLAIEVILQEFKSTESRKAIQYLSQAYELSVDNVKHLNMEGSTAVVFDSSGSMTASVRLADNKQSYHSAIAKATLIAATLGKGLGADVYHFDTRCRELTFNPADSIHSIGTGFMKQAGGGGTDFGCILPVLSKRYDRIFIISDMQGGDDGGFKRTLGSYKSKFGANPYIYSINLCGYTASSIKPNDRVFQLAGYSAAIYETAKGYEVDPNALLNEIRAVKL